MIINLGQPYGACNRVQTPHQVAEQKCRQLQKLNGGFEPPTTHQGGRGAVQTARWVRPGLGELVAPKGIGAPCTKAIIGLGVPKASLDYICCKMQPEDLHQ
ncbi:hypothetical protein DSO57_1036628 [Entomophthora muscae]|uniref:Uncharacterized protein n=1 Tax=Entomophthora muscae TaxID=34485 RepID=A0ACC2U8K5_9FUNG|nr:hypothetical protein DSO57_1036628 [Entomophthora muscae]